MNTVLSSLLVFPLFCSLLIPTVVLIWYMRWRKKEQRETAQHIETLVAALSNAEVMIERLGMRRENEKQVIGMPVSTEHPHPVYSVMPHDEIHHDSQTGAIEKAKVLLRGGIPPVEVAKTLDMGLGEVEMLHRMITMMERRETVPA